MLLCVSDEEGEGLQTVRLVAVIAIMGAAFIDERRDGSQKEAGGRAARKGAAGSGTATVVVLIAALLGVPVGGGSCGVASVAGAAVAKVETVT